MTLVDDSCEALRFVRRVLGLGEMRALCKIEAVREKQMRRPTRPTRPTRPRLEAGESVHVDEGWMLVKTKGAISGVAMIRRPWRSLVAANESETALRVSSAARVAMSDGVQRATLEAHVESARRGGESAEYLEALATIAEKAATSDEPMCVACGVGFYPLHETQRLDTRLGAVVGPTETYARVELLLVVVDDETARATLGRDELVEALRSRLRCAALALAGHLVDVPALHDELSVLGPVTPVAASTVVYIDHAVFEVVEVGTAGSSAVVCKRARETVSLDGATLGVCAVRYDAALERLVACACDLRALLVFVSDGELADEVYMQVRIGARTLYDAGAMRVRLTGRIGASVAEAHAELHALRAVEFTTVVALSPRRDEELEAMPSGAIVARTEAEFGAVHLYLEAGATPAAATELVRDAPLIYVALASESRVLYSPAFKAGAATLYHEAAGLCARLDEATAEELAWALKVPFTESADDATVHAAIDDMARRVTGELIARVGPHASKRAVDALGLDARTAAWQFVAGTTAAMAAAYARGVG
jgi:hypothetical protein